jgi:hypothetical protein
MHSKFSEKCLTEFKAGEDLYQYMLKENCEDEITDKIYSQYFYSRIYIAKRIAKSVRWYQFTKFKTICKQNIPILDKNRKIVLSNKQQLECFIYSYFKAIFFITYKIFYSIKSSKIK